jgi:hypothetical protein
MDFYSSADEEQDLAEWLAGQAGPGEDAFAGAYEADVIDLAGAMDAPAGADSSGEATPVAD